MFEIFFLVAVTFIDLAYLIILFSINLPPEKAVIKKLPGISVIIASKDGRIIGKTLRKLKSIGRLKMEIIVVTNSRETVKIAREYTRKVIVDKGVGKGAALNSAMKKASYKILYFMDEDMIVKKDTIEKVCSALNGNEVAAGFNTPRNKNSTIARIARLYIVMLTKMQYGIYRLIGTTFVGGRNFAIYKKTIKSVGNFRNVLAEDIDLSFRLFMKGKKVKFVHAKASDDAISKFSWYVKQQQRWNSGAGQAIMQWEKRLHHHDILLFLFVVLVALIPLMSIVSVILALLFSNYFFFSMIIICFLIALSSSMALDGDEIILSPLTFLMFIVVQSCTILYSAVRKPHGWYRTPKE